MKRSINSAGPFLYALIFLLLIPWVLIQWASWTEGEITYPPISSTPVGSMLMVFGGVLILWAMIALKRFGQGLPMNAYPPPQFVSQGPYRLFHHPIYIGFGVALIGYFLYKGSASGLWLVSPITVLCMTALVWGYEYKDLKERFPAEQLHTLLDLSADGQKRLSFRHRLVSSISLLLPLMAYNYLSTLLDGNVAPDWELTWSWPFLSNLPLGSFLGIGYLFWVCGMAGNMKELKAIRKSVFIALALALYLSLLYPELGIQSSGTESINALVSLWHLPVYIVFITLWHLRQRRFIGLVLTGIWGVLVILQTFGVMSSVPMHLMLSFIVFLVSVCYPSIWNVLRNFAQWIANSWKEWRLGKLRVINHGFYVGFAAFFGIFLAGILSGPGYAWGLLVFALIVVIFSALWAQVIEGSEKLKRPYGFYGALVGIIFGSGAVWAMGLNGWLIIGVVSVVMPWVQAVGRLRCLINGCCHGHKVEDSRIGIRYYHPRSRVCGISNLKGELLHPTQLYAIIWLLLIGCVLLELWLNGSSAAMVFGLYLILTGIGRFVEEAYRGEVQTAIIAGLRLYQWTAILSVLVGMVLTMIQVSVTASTPVFNLPALVAALLGGLFVFIAMGVDFPESNARFSRLV